MASNTIGRYEIQKEIGHGSMGVVYQAHDPILRRTIALKTFSLAFVVSDGERASFEERFLQEARAAAALSHPCIVVVYDVGVEPGTGLAYMALEYLRGKTLEGILAQGERLDWRESLRTTSRLADALHHAHSNGVIHRDIKPANVMVLASGEPKIMDFGVAKVDASELTGRGQVLGSPPYMSPEQAAGEPMDARSDLFSLGALLYELLTGTKAFGAPDLPTILMRIAREHPPPPSQSVPILPRDLDAIVARALAKSPADRYPSGRAFAEDIENLLAGRPLRHARPGPPAAKAAPAVERTGEGTARSGEGRASLAFPPGKRVSLAFMSGPLRGEMLAFARPSVLIGRSGGGVKADVEIPDPEVSRAHAVVECHGTRIVVRDLESRNGTFVGTERIQERELEDRAEFRVGRTILMLIVTEEEWAAS